jgi:type I restriction enzyme S subunit
MDLKPEYLAMVRDILATHVPGMEVRIFGSRAIGPAKPHSDLDLALIGDGKVDFGTMARLKDAFSESDLPFRVDVLDWNDISPEFQSVIAQNYVVVQEKTNAS